MKKKMLATVLVVVMLVSCLFAFTACNNDTKPTEITFVLDWAPNTNHTGLYVAKNLGYYEAEDLKVNIVQPGNTGTSAEVSTNVGQFGIDFQEQMIWNEQQKVNVTAVASVVQHNTSGIISQKAKGIVKPADMVGHKYATWGLPGEQAIVKAMIKSAGKDPADLDMVPNTVENIIAEFQNPNGVDCVWSYAAWDKIILEQANIETNFIWMKDIEGLDYYTPVIIANNDFLKNNPKEAQAFIRATAKGYDYAINHPKEAADILMKENPELAESKDVIYASQNYLAGEYKSDAPYWGHIEQARWDGFFNLVCGLGEQDFPAKVTAGFGFTNEYLPKEA